MATNLRPKAETIADMAKAFELSENDTGSPEIQIALLSERINHLTEHLKTFGFSASFVRFEPTHLGLFFATRRGWLSRIWGKLRG